MSTPRQHDGPDAGSRAAPSRAWRRNQNRMVVDIAQHALAGGSGIAGEEASPEQAISAYLEVLRRDLLKHAARGG